MIIRLCNGRRIQASLKVIACLLSAIFYFAFLFRESLNAYERKKGKIEQAAMAAGLLQQPAKVEIKNSPLSYKHIQRAELSGREHTKTNQLSHILTPALTSTLNPVYEYSEEIHAATERDLRKRNAHLQEICEKYNLQFEYPPNPKEFLISAGHNLVWCNVFKAASSTWMYYFNILGGYDIKFLQRNDFIPLELARKRFPRPDLQELSDSLPSSLSFLFARDPFERLVSAYRNKLEGGKHPYYKGLCTKIIKKYRKPVALPANAGGSYSSGSKGPTFNEFVKYVIGQYVEEGKFDEHWAPIYSFCTPCSINFTIIGKVETFGRDSEFLIRQAGLEFLLLGKIPKPMKRKIGNISKGLRTKGSLPKYFSTIDRSTLNRLLDIYRLDFELFDYDYQKYYNYVQSPTQPTTLFTLLEGGAIGHNNNNHSITLNANTNTTAIASTTTTTKATTTTTTKSPALKFIKHNFTNI